MKRLSHSQLQNLIFIGIVMLVAAAMVVYMLLGGNLPAAKTEAALATPAPTAAPVKAPVLKCVGAPVSVMLAHLEGDGRLTAAERSGHEYALYLAGEPEKEIAVMSLTESDGAVTSLSWRFRLPDEPGTKPQNEIEKRIAENYKTDLSALRMRVEPVLTVCIAAGDLNSLLREPVLQCWVEGALGTAESGKSYRNVAEGCAFTANISEQEGETTLVCALLFR